MPHYLSTLSFHHDTDSNTYGDVFEAKDQQEADYKAFCILLIEQGCNEEALLQLNSARIREALQAAPAAGDQGVPLRLLLSTDPTDAGELVLCVWDFQEGDERNFGASPSPDGTMRRAERHETNWLKVQPWEPDQAKLADLLTRDPEELANAILLASATGKSPLAFL